MAEAVGVRFFTPEQCFAADGAETMTGRIGDVGGASGGASGGGSGALGAEAQVCVREWGGRVFGKAPTLSLCLTHPTHPSQPAEAANDGSSSDGDSYDTR